PGLHEQPILLVFNKTDLLDEEALLHLQERVLALVPNAIFVNTTSDAARAAPRRTRQAPGGRGPHVRSGWAHAGRDPRARRGPRPTHRRRSAHRPGTAAGAAARPARTGRREDHLGGVTAGPSDNGVRHLRCLTPASGF